jgi:siderophore synthetase component
VEVALSNSTDSRAKALSWEIASRRLIAKALSEFSHEMLLEPRRQRNEEHWQRFVLSVGAAEYTFRAQRLELDDWLVDEHSITKSLDGAPAALNAAAFVLEFKDAVGIPKLRLAEYLNAITRTTYALAFRIELERRELLSRRASVYSVKHLARASFQEIEGAMCAGHPVFVANADRRGFSAEEHEAYAPELRPQFRLRWLAVRRHRCVTSCITGASYKEFVASELTTEERQGFEQSLKNAGLDESEFELVPVHPWQWRNRIAQSYARDLARGEIVDLGEGIQEYQPQQSLRTMLSNHSKKRHYTKCSLGVVNMGFSRGISPTLPSRGAAVNEWIEARLHADPELRRLGFQLLREVCFVGVPHYYYDQISNKRSDEYRESLGALWRENPLSRVSENQQVMTMAALFHVDESGASLLAELVHTSGVSVDVWIRDYVEAYLVPLIHCLYRHNLVFTPHPENVLLILENGRPKGMFIKDLAEDIGIINPDTPSPPEVAHITLSVPDEWVTLCIFTDSFDGVLRFIARLLHKHLGHSVREFWQQVAAATIAYQAAHPELDAKFEQWDLFAPTFARNCLNRLQLNNPDEMLDLNSPDPAGLLQFSGTLINPIATFKPQRQNAFRIQAGRPNAERSPV